MTLKEIFAVDEEDGEILVCVRTGDAVVRVIGTPRTGSTVYCLIAEPEHSSRSPIEAATIRQRTAQVKEKVFHSRTPVAAG